VSLERRPLDPAESAVPEHRSAAWLPSSPPRGSSHH